MTCDACAQAAPVALWMSPTFGVCADCNLDIYVHTTKVFALDHRVPNESEKQQCTQDI